jgi:hypothetical protein
MEARHILGKSKRVMNRLRSGYTFSKKAVVGDDLAKERRGHDDVPYLLPSSTCFSAYT